jgi:hypothetical protein
MQQFQQQQYQQQLVQQQQAQKMQTTPYIRRADRSITSSGNTPQLAPSVDNSLSEEAVLRLQLKALEEQSRAVDQSMVQLQARKKELGTSLEDLRNKLKAVAPLNVSGPTHLDLVTQQALFQPSEPLVQDNQQVLTTFPNVIEV